MAKRTKKSAKMRKVIADQSRLIEAQAATIKALQEALAGQS